MSFIYFLLITIGYIIKLCLFSIGFFITGILLSELIDSIKKDKKDKAA